MSYFLFGAITTDSSLRDDNELAWRVAVAAASERLFILLGPNLHQKPVLDVLESRGLVGSGYMPLLLTRSPLRETSEELLADYHPTESHPQSARSTFVHVSEWVRYVLLIPEVRGICLFTSDGFDDCFDEFETSVDQLTDTMMSRIEKEGDVPSLCVHIISNITSVE